MNEPIKKYQAIPCGFHDYLEHFTTLKQVVTLQYKDENEVIVTHDAIIRDLSGGRAGEYVHFLKDGAEQKIRMDYLISVGGIRALDFPNTTCRTA